MQLTITASSADEIAISTGDICLTQMSRKTILSVACPLTKGAKAAKQLIEFVTVAPCKELPAIFALANREQLMKSSKGVVYYMTSPTVGSLFPALKKRWITYSHHTA